MVFNHIATGSTVNFKVAVTLDDQNKGSPKINYPSAASA